MSNIIFVGDSFCSATDSQTWQQQQSRHQGYLPDGELGYPSLVAKHYGAKLHCFGYGGKSWWYSYQQYIKALAAQPTWWDDLVALVFCHTDSHRINTTDEELTTTHAPHIFPRSNCKSAVDQQLASAYEQYVRYLVDDDFQRWAHQQYFRELANTYGNPLPIPGAQRRVKTIHFHCFEDTVIMSGLLPGRVFTTALNAISRCEFAGTDDEFIKFVSTADHRANHLNTHNNQALAQVIIDSVDHYVEGESPINLSGFDQPCQ